jgi:hypothetical protein
VRREKALVSSGSQTRQGTGSRYPVAIEEVVLPLSNGSHHIYSFLIHRVIALGIGFYRRPLNAKCPRY